MRWRQLQYLVKWKGYPLNEASWESEDKLKNAPKLVAKFHASNPDALRSKCIQGSIIPVIKSTKFLEWRQKNVRPSIIEDDHARERVMSRVPNTNHYSYLNIKSKSKRPCHVTKPCLPFTYIATQHQPITSSYITSSPIHSAHISPVASPINVLIDLP
ncbi:hypothetical protein AZE42_12643 [Rhizopogon vesiculosus]|uniref:Chromo domain-containing protein n=1 Tax=Rhizopogon vesiculosus TaxID=180088 RepID=A0A1J8Q014_9AGAM|nr:hypothetical protein AZE42_12643 [Rhizopogon vesiculosus]